MFEILGHPTDLSLKNLGVNTLKVIMQIMFLRTKWVNPTVDLSRENRIFTQDQVINIGIKYSMPRILCNGNGVLPHLQMGVAVMGFVENFRYGLHNA